LAKDRLQVELTSQGPADLTCTTDTADVEFRGVLQDPTWQDPEVLSPSTESLLRGVEDRNDHFAPLVVCLENWHWHFGSMAHAAVSHH
jgi:hypothetical protein